MRIPENTKKFLIAVVAVVAVIVAGVWLFLNPVEHIEDTNGADNYALQTITDETILNMDYGAIGGPKISTMGNTVKFSADKFTGVYEILYDNLLGASDFVLDLTSFEVSGGNFTMVVVHDGEIVATLTPDLFVEYRLEDVSGTVSLRIAGESAAFSFSMTKSDYDSHAHDM